MSKVKEIFYNADGRAQCSAKLSSWTPDEPKRCRSVILMTNGRCRKHGGATPSGMASVHYRNGRHSKYLPERLIERYQEALSDPEMHSLEGEIALVDARISDLLGSSDEGGATNIFLEIADAWTALEYAKADGVDFEIIKAERRISKAIVEGKQEQLIWEEIRQLQEQRRKLVLAEAKRLQITNQMVTVEKVNLLIAALLDAMRQRLMPLANGRQLLAKISEDFMRITRGSTAEPLKKLAP